MQSTQQPEAAKPTAAAVEFIAPDVNIYETKDGYVLEADMPGVSKEGLQITLEGSEITLAGRQNREPAPGERLFRERRPADFRRVFELDPAIDTGRITARMHQGVLTLTLPKSEQVRPRKIAVVD